MTLDKMTPKTARSILKVKKGATRPEIKQAYRRMVFRYHPDSGGGDDEKIELGL